MKRTQLNLSQRSRLELQPFQDVTRSDPVCAHDDERGSCLSALRKSGWRSRSGATLSEALVALLVMSIGVVSLASLFPVAVLKTARANQLTIATNLRYNAEALMKVYPWIYADPNPVDTAIQGVIPDGNPFNDYDFSASRPYLFDPLATIPGRPVPMPTALGILPRYSGGFDVSAATADAICSGPDTWSLIHEASVTSMNAGFTQMELNDLNAVGIQWPGPNQMRVQIFFNGGKSSMTRMVTGIGTNNVLLWTEDINGNSTLDANEDQNGNFVLDAHALPGVITYESARLESRERRFTWLLTVRPQDTGASFTGSLGAKPSFDVSVVVYFGRGFSPQEEQVYGTVPVGVPAVLNLVGSSTVTLQEGSRLFTVTWPSGSTPAIKRGGYVLDAQHGYWYQVENYTDTTGSTSSVVTLTSNILERSTLVAFPRGVVDVFPISSQTPE